MRPLLVTAILLCACAARADEAGWLATVQIGPGVAPNYAGARSYRAVPNPGLSVRRANEPERFSAPDDSFGAPILDASGFRAGPVGNLILPRWRTHPETYGLKPRRAALELGGFAEYFLPSDAVRFRAELRQGVYGHHGLVASVSSDIIARAGAFTFSAGPRASFATSAALAPSYSVAPWEAALNQRVTPYDAHTSFASAGFMTTARYDFNARWNVTGYGGLNRLAGAAAASPIPRLIGSRNQFNAGLLLARTFAIGPL
ncbi:MAG: MipA/OmpV family protein [Hyphomicrobiales bacterium]|nr:MipA/OmpV family protein [Hyphomicrobiales bacterium]